MGTLPDFVSKSVAFFIDLAAGVYNQSEPDKNDILRAAYNLTEKACLSFNLDHPEPLDKGIDYYTYAGVANAPLPWKDNADEVDLELWPIWQILRDLEESGREANDGLVSLWSAKYKNEYYQPYNGAPLIADHYNQVGQILGITDPDYNHLDFFLYLAGQLKESE